MSTIMILCNTVATTANKTFEVCQSYTDTGIFGISWQEVAALAIIGVLLISVLYLIYVWTGRVETPNNNDNNSLKEEKDVVSYKNYKAHKENTKALFKDICSLCKDDTGKIDLNRAKELLVLYIQIDEYDKPKTETTNEGTQN